MTILELEELVRGGTASIAEKLTLAIARNTEGWITWMALQSDVAAEEMKGRKA